MTPRGAPKRLRGDAARPGAGAGCPGMAVARGPPRPGMPSLRLGSFWTAPSLPHAAPPPRLPPLQRRGGPGVCGGVAAGTRCRRAGPRRRRGLARQVSHFLGLVPGSGPRGAPGAAPPARPPRRAGDGAPRDGGGGRGRERPQPVARASFGGGGAPGGDTPHTHPPVSSAAQPGERLSPVFTAVRHCSCYARCYVYSWSTALLMRSRKQLRI